MGGVEQSILHTLIYADIFDYPLTKKELWKFLISSSSVQKNTFEQQLKLYKNSYKGYYFLSGRKNIVQKRIEREKESRKKLLFAKKIVTKLSHIPTIQLIGISGGLAVENAEKYDDIDLFIITRKNTLWTTRLITIVILELLGVRRRRNEDSSPDKICLNMMIDESVLAVPKSKQNLYTAHEIVQLNAVHIQDNIHQRFLRANTWVKNYLPNSIDKSVYLNTYKNEKFPNKTLILGSIRVLLNLLESFTKNIQLWYMRKYRTTEIITDATLAFHPFDYGEYVMREYRKRLKKYGL